MAQNTTTHIAALVTALAPELTTAIEADRQTRLRAALQVIRDAPDLDQPLLIAILSATMRISPSVVRTIMREG